VKSFDMCKDFGKKGSKNGKKEKKQAKNLVVS
jgi:hypothetical protein